MNDSGTILSAAVENRPLAVRAEADVLKTIGGEPQQVARLRAGECFGEMALLNETRRNATVRCSAPMDALSLPKSEFTLLAANLPDLRSSFQRIAAERSDPSAVASHDRWAS